MNEELSGGFRIKDWEVVPLRDLLNGPDGEHHVEPKAMQVLVTLASQPGQVVTREALLDQVWPNTYSGEVSLTRCISQLRHCFSDERGDSEFIETIPKIGYRLVAPVEPFVEASHREPLKPITWVTAAIVVLFLGVSYLVYDRLVLEPERRTVTVRAVDPSQYSIAVLPFANVSDDPANEYFSDGVSEDILNLLAKVPELQVTSRTSAFSFKGQNLDVPTIAAKLNVARVLEGSVRKSGDQLRITAQLIDVETDSHLWASTFDRELKDVFAIQDEIAIAVVDALKITLLGDEPKATETDPDAYALYLQARYFLNQFTGESNLRQAETLLEQALEIDRGFAPAWYLLGIVYKWQAALDIGPRSLDDGYELARQTINKALDVDPQYGPAYAALAELEMDYGWDFTAATQHLQLALALGPGDADILINAAHLNRILGRLDEAIDLYRQALALDPVSYLGRMYLGISYLNADRLDEAADSARMLLSLNPGGIIGHYLLGLVLLAQGDAPAALAEIEQENHGTFRLHGTAIVQHELGNAGASDAALEKLIECCGGFDPPSADYQIAQVYAIRGEIDNAFEWLEIAYDYRDGALPTMLTSKAFTNLHDDPRWQPFLDKMGLPH